MDDADVELTEFVDVVDGKGGNDTIEYGDLSGATYEFDNTNNVWKITVDSGTASAVAGSDD